MKTQLTKLGPLDDVVDRASREAPCRVRHAQCIISSSLFLARPGFLLLGVEGSVPDSLVLSSVIRRSGGNLILPLGLG